MEARKNKNTKNFKPSVKVTTTPRLNAEERNLTASDQKMDEGKDWTKSPTEEAS